MSSPGGDVSSSACTGLSGQTRRDVTPFVLRLVRMPSLVKFSFASCASLSSDIVRNMCPLHLNLTSMCACAHSLLFLLETRKPQQLKTSRVFLFILFKPCKIYPWSFVRLRSEVCFSVPSLDICNLMCFLCSFCVY